MNPIINATSVTIFKGFVPVTINKGHRNYLEIRRLAKQFDGDYASMLALADSIEQIVKAVANAGEKCRISVKGNEILYDGKGLHNVVAGKLLDMMSEGIVNINPWFKFVENVMLNPSQRATDELMDFMDYKKLPIDSEGNIIAYKGVGSDNWSITANTETRVVKGKVDETGRIFNGVGEQIEVERGSVNDDREIHCSEGLHVGSFDYARSFGSNLKLVRVNPKDVVSVPSDCKCQKMRVCAYTVIADIDEFQTDLKMPVYSIDKKEFVDNEVSRETLEDALNSLVESIAEDLYVEDQSCEDQPWEDAWEKTIEDMTLDEVDSLVREYLPNNVVIDRSLLITSWADVMEDYDLTSPVEIKAVKPPIKGSPNNETTQKKIVSYVDNYVEKYGFGPQMSQIQSRLNGSVHPVPTCQQIYNIVTGLDYLIEGDKDLGVSKRRIAVR